jgi:hypothetical protein
MLYRAIPCSPRAVRAQARRRVAVRPARASNHTTARETRAKISRHAKHAARHAKQGARFGSRSDGCTAKTPRVPPIHKFPQDRKFNLKLRSSATSVSGTELAQGTVVCGSCAPRVGGQAVQLRKAESRSAARHAMQTCAPGEEQRRASWLKRQHVEVLQEEALLALEDSLPA